MSTILLLFGFREVNNEQPEESPRFVTSLLHVNHLLLFGTLFILCHMGANSSVDLTLCIMDYPIPFDMTENRKASNRTTPVKCILIFFHIVLNMSKGSV